MEARHIPTTSGTWVSLYAPIKTRIGLQNGFSIINSDIEMGGIGIRFREAMDLMEVMVCTSLAFPIIVRLRFCFTKTTPPYSHYLIFIALLWYSRLTTGRSS